MLGNVKPVTPILDRNLGTARPVLLRVDNELAGGDLRPVEGLPVRAGSHRRDTGSHVVNRDTDALRQEGHDLQDRPHIQVDRVISQRTGKLRDGLLGQL